MHLPYESLHISLYINCVIYCSLSQLSELKSLDLCYNNISGGLPDVIGQLKSLNTLKLDGCHLTTLPDR